MPTYFADSSTLVKRYVHETGSAWVNSLFAPFPHDDVYIVSITAVEMVAALMRRSRSGSVTSATAMSACSLFLSDLPQDYQVVEVAEALINLAIDLAQRYKLRGYDAVQLAAACQINALCLSLGLDRIIFTSADRELTAAAQSEGLAVDDPNSHP
jgi:predicted nucleic acid-binding protein